MRVAIQLMYKDGIDAIIAKYNQLARHHNTEATPKMVNSLKLNASMFSCCLLRPSDSLEGIMESITMLAKESKYSGGDAFDVSLIRAPGATVEGNKGSSSGAIPYIKALETGISGFNQGNTRSSACVCTFDSFHYQSPEMAELKLETGKDDDRARKLQYSVKWRRKLSEAIKNNEDIYLIDPHKTKDLFESYGDEWDILYNKYSNNTRIHKRKYNARDLGHTIVSTSADTGNLYYTLIDNLNSQDISGQYVPASNLCQEMAMNYDPITQVKAELITTTSQFTFDGDIALCNLLAVNLIKWVSFTDKQKEEEIYLMVKSADNAIDNSFYINPLGEKHSKQWRNIAIGVSNYANVLATNKVQWNSKEARELTHKLFEELQFYAIKASIQLAKERSRFDKFNTTLWAKGIFPHELSILHKTDSDLNYPLQQEWESLRKELLMYGIRNCRLIGLMPTATSGKCINATEGIDAPRKLKTIQEGTYSLPFIVPNLRENREYYQTTFEIDNKDVIELAAVRQKFVCMSQSVSLAYHKADSSYEMIKNIMYAEELGLKTIYYTHTKNAEDSGPEICESCG
jgi:ribonucleoside-diphosphate reductase alpha chain